MMKILITGCSGQLGHALARTFAGEKLLLTDFKTLDITSFSEVDRILGENKPDLVINAAAYTQVDKAEQERAQAFKVNAEGPENLAKITASLDIPLIHMSTDYVFDGTGSEPYTEESVPSPCSVYGESKLEGEKRVAQNNPKHFIIRTSWLYSIWGHNFVKTMIRLAGQGNVKVVQDQVGSPTYVMHLSQAIARVARSQDYGLWHMAGGGQTTWYDLTRELFRQMKIDVMVRPITTDEFRLPARRPAYSVLTSLRQPPVALPHWKTGITDFVRDLTCQPGCTIA